MKQLYYTFFILFLVCLTGCYNNESGNDFDTTLQEVNMVIPQNTYSASLGECITIVPEVTTDIPESDLEFIWEVDGDLFNKNGRDAFFPLMPEGERTKVLNYICHLDENITSLNTSYTCRLHARQISTGRDFYSKNTFTLTIEGITGLMILHGDDNSSDIGILTAEEFVPISSSIPNLPNAQPSLYSSNNGGTYLKGKGESIVQSIVTYMFDEESKKRARIYAKTDAEVAFINHADFSYYGDWNSLFYLAGRPEQIHSNDPQGYLVVDQLVIAFDGNDTFMGQQSSNNSYPLLFPEFGDNNTCSDGHKFRLSSFFQKVTTSGIQYLLYARSIDGDETHKGFVGLSGTSSNYANYARLLDTKGDLVPFNPGNMNADLVYMATDNRNHVLAVLKGNTTHPTYANKYFAVDLWPNPTSDSGESGFKGIPQSIYDLSSFPYISEAVGFAFGTAQNMAYYATPSKIYQYGFEGTTLYPATPLTMCDGSELSISGEITLMKFLESPNVETHNVNPILVVATWDGNNAALYALHVSTGDGKVLKVVRYDSETVEGWNFSRISDVNIKGM